MDKSGKKETVIAVDHTFDYNAMGLSENEENLINTRVRFPSAAITKNILTIAEGMFIHSFIHSLFIHPFIHSFIFQQGNI